MWTHGFRRSFTPLRGVLFTFPSRYWFAIGLPGVFSLAGWSRQIRAGVLGPRPTQARRHARAAVRLRGHHPLRRAVPGASAPAARAHPRRPTTPAGPKPDRFGLIPFRSPLLGESRLLSPPPATGMFRFAGFAPLAGWRARLPRAYRGLPRPSSPPGARASTVRPASLPARSRRRAAPTGPGRTRRAAHRAHAGPGGIPPPGHPTAGRAALAGGPAGLWSTCQRTNEWRMSDSNRRPPACKAGALAS